MSQTPLSGPGRPRVNLIILFLINCCAVLSAVGATAFLFRLTAVDPLVFRVILVSAVVSPVFLVTFFYVRIYRTKVGMITAAITIYVTILAIFGLGLGVPAKDASSAYWLDRFRVARDERQYVCWSVLAGAIVGFCVVTAELKSSGIGASKEQS